jgi:pseudouridine kinase
MTVQRTTGVLVVGGANMDLKARSARPVLAGTSNPGEMLLSPGGVGRNIAENAARLGAPVALVSIVGSDGLGIELLEATEAAGVDVSEVLRTAETTGTYTALLDADGELVAAVAAMAATDGLDPAHVAGAVARAAAGTLVVADGNLPPAVLEAVLGAARSAGLRVVVEPVSVPKALRLAPVLHGPVFLVTPNRDELAALTGVPVETLGGPDSPGGLVQAAEKLRADGAEWVWVRLGSEGSILVGPEGSVTLPPYRVEVVDVTGAGDAMLGAFCSALVAGSSVEEAARFGQAAAVVTIASHQTVVSNLDIARVREVLDAADH